MWGQVEGEKNGYSGTDGTRCAFHDRPSSSAAAAYPFWTSSVESSGLLIQSSAGGFESFSKRPFSK